MKLNKYLTAIILLINSAQPAYAKITNPILPNFGSGNYGEVFAKMIANIWKAFVILGGIFFILYFAFGALRWMTAEGDKTKFEESRQKITNAFIGLTLLAASVALVQLLGSLLEIEFLENLMFTFPTP